MSEDSRTTSPADPLTGASRPLSEHWLAIETSGLYGSVAVGKSSASGCAQLAAAPLPTNARSAQTLSAGIGALLEQVGVSPAEVGTVAVTAGPGSFTGLRVGVVSAKAFAYAVGARVIGVDTLDVLAEGAPVGEGALWTVLNAQRGELFVARFTPDGRWRRDSATDRVSRDDLISRLEPGDRAVGPDAESVTRDGVESVAAEPRAEDLLQVAWRQRLESDQTPFSLAPNYHRLSAAEEKAGASRA